MGKIKGGILGGFSGKVGNVTGSSWKGIAYMKSIPQSVANPKTAGQVAQRSKFTNVIAFAGIILAEIIKPLWDRFASGESGYNVFTRTNIALFTGVLPDPFADLVISQGKMAATQIDALSLPLASKIVGVTWVVDTGEGFKLSTDEPYVVAINETTGETVSISGGVSRADGETEVEFTTDMAALDVVHVYLAFRRIDGTIVSNTAYKTDTAPNP